jgi:general secretion pathway protein N
MNKKIQRDYMKKWFTLGAIFFTSYLIFVLATLPLPWLINKVTLPKNITLHGVSGTVWQGEIAQVILSNSAKNTQVEQVTTALSVWSLFSLTPQIDVRFGDAFSAGPEGKMTLAVSQEQLSLTDVELFLSANDIAQQANLPLPVTAKGELELHLTQVDISLSEQKCQQANGNVDWSHAGIIAMEQNIKLGKLQAKVSCEKGDLVVKIEPKNDLGLSFSTYIGIKGGAQKGQLKTSGQGYLTPGSKFPPELKSVLPFLGNVDNQGRYRLMF